MNRDDFDRLWRHVVGIAILGFGPLVAAEPNEIAKSQPRTMSGDEAGQVRDDNALKIELVWCPAGFVRMETIERSPRDNSEDDSVVDVEGDAAEAPTRTARVRTVNAFISHGYWI